MAATSPMRIFLLPPPDSSPASRFIPPKVKEGADPITAAGAGSTEAAGECGIVVGVAGALFSIVTGCVYSRAGAGALAAPLVMIF